MTDKPTRDLDACMPAHACVRCVHDVGLARIVMHGDELPESGVEVTVVIGGRAFYASVIGLSAFDRINERGVPTKLFGSRLENARVLAEEPLLPQCLWLPMINLVPENGRCILPALKVRLCDINGWGFPEPVLLEPEDN